MRNILRKQTNMNIYITATNDCKLDEIDKVIEILNQVPGELRFISDHPLTIEQIKHTIPNIDEQPLSQLTFNQFFDLANFYRIINRDVKANDIVTILTHIPNNRNWFSAFNNKNIFINCNDWEIYHEGDTNYSVAYQVVSNTFQSLLELDIQNYRNEPNIHIESKGCINDMCINKKEIRFKLLSAEICKSCLDKADEMKLSPERMYQIGEIIEICRKGIKSLRPNKNEVTPAKVFIDSNYNISIADRPIIMQPLPKTLFIFFLKHIEGVHFDKMEDYKDELKQIYIQVRGSNPRDNIITKLCLPDTLGGTFQVQKSNVNIAIRKSLNEDYAEFYFIDRIKEISEDFYKINISPDSINLDPRL